MSQFEYDFLFASLAARKFLDKYFPGESTFVDISDYASRVGLSGLASALSDVEVKVPKVEKVPGGCLHFAVSLVPEAHPLAEDRVATIALIGAQDLPVPDGLVDKLKGQIQNVYFVIERGFSRTTSGTKVDCEGCPQFSDQVGPEVFQGSQAALVEFDQENSMITVKIHRKEPPKSKYESETPAEPEVGSGEEEGEEEEVDDVNDELIAFCEFNLWDLVDIERGNHQVDLLERITQTFDCLTPNDSIRILSNECHPSMVNLLGRSIIELKGYKTAIEEGEVPEVKADSLVGGLVSSFKDKFKKKFKGALQGIRSKAGKALGTAADAVLDKLDDDADEDEEQPEEDPEAIDVQNRIFIAKRHLKRTILSIRTLVGMSPSSRSF